MSQGRQADGKGKGFLVEIGSFVLIAVAVWLGWQALREVAADRLPPALALRISPDSPRVLARAAEIEFVAKRFDNAGHLARQSLAGAPFNVPALRIVGLVKAEEGASVEANDILTLAGNWSLRDDPSHAWLVRYRLSRGDYGSAFAHADTLARRRVNLHPQLFELFTTAATLDNRAVPALATLLAAKPPWRIAYLQSLYQSNDGLTLAGNLALTLQRSDGGAFTDWELSGLYTHLMRRGRLPAMAEIRRRLRRPSPDLVLVNGGFEPPSPPFPYNWGVFTAPGAVAEIVEDDLRTGDNALRARYDGFRPATFAEQLVQLKPGAYRLSGRQRTELGEAAGRLSWVVSCLESALPIADTREARSADRNNWEGFAVDFVVPAQGCTGQWVRLTSRPGDQRTMIIAWYDGLAISARP